MPKDKDQSYKIKWECGPETREIVRNTANDPQRNTYLQAVFDKPIIKFHTSLFERPTRQLKVESSCSRHRGGKDRIIWPGGMRWSAYLMLQDRISLRFFLI